MVSTLVKLLSKYLIFAQVTKVRSECRLKLHGKTEVRLHLSYREEVSVF